MKFLSISMTLVLLFAVASAESSARKDGDSGDYNDDEKQQIFKQAMQLVDRAKKEVAKNIGNKDIQDLIADIQIETAYVKSLAQQVKNTDDQFLLQILILKLGDHETTLEFDLQKLPESRFKCPEVAR